MLGLHPRRPVCRGVSLHGEQRPEGRAEIGIANSPGFKQTEEAGVQALVRSPAGQKDQEQAGKRSDDTRLRHHLAALAVCHPSRSCLSASLDPEGAGI